MSNKCVVCLVVCEKFCAHCKKANYCSVEHQKQHRKEHKAECFPSIEKECKEMDRTRTVATRNIKPGEVVTVKKAIMVSPDPLILTEPYPICLGCCIVLPGKLEDNKLICTSCMWPLCNPGCKQKHWHTKFECEVFQTNKFRPVDISKSGWDRGGLIYAFIRVLRLILLKHKLPEQWKKFISLEPNSELYGTKLSIEKAKYEAAVFLRVCCKINEPKILVDRVYILSHTNDTRIYAYASKHQDDSYDQKVVLPGRRLMSKIFGKKDIEHSCQPNTQMVGKFDVNDWNTVSYIATVEIQAGEFVSEFSDYEECRINLKGHAERRMMHMPKTPLTKIGLLCNCPMCIDPTEQGTFASAIKCSKPNCPGYFLPCIVTSVKPSPDNLALAGKWKCNFAQCNKEETYSKLSKTVDRIKMEIDREKSLEGKLKLIAKHENVTLHENHFLLTKLRFELLDPLMHQASQLGLRNDDNNKAKILVIAEKIKNFASKCMLVAGTFYPGLSAVRGILLTYILLGTYVSIINKYNKEEIAYQLRKEKPKMLELRREAMAILGILGDHSFGSTLYKKLRAMESLL